MKQVGQTLPSTSQLISEHQARQQQALFKALARRQKLMDELGHDQAAPDLMASSALGEARVLRAVRRRRGKRSQQDDGAVPLSSVDLSSVSDRMLDELLGHIASASSSSSTLSSSDFSCDLSNSSSSSELRLSPDHNSCAPDELEGDAPNVVGVHEDERRCSQKLTASRALNCRDTSRCDPTFRDQDDDDDNNNHNREVSVRVVGQQGAEPTGDSLSPRNLEPRQSQNSLDGSKQNFKLEQYFTSQLVSPHEFLPPSSPTEDRPVATGQSVEVVLAGMLEALDSIGADQHEELNELLERGFTHLEQLLNCSLAPEILHGSSAGVGHPNMAQKVISSQQQHVSSLASTTMSRDSDYGSDTKSADCLSQYNDTTAPSARYAGGAISSQATSSESPSPVSLATSFTSRQMSPLAIELSFKLADSLRRLAQHQSGQQPRLTSRPELEPETKAEETEEEPEEGLEPEGSAIAEGAEREIVVPLSRAEPPKRSPMKSIVLVNGSQSASSTLSSSRNLTPELETKRNSSCSPRQQYKTRVNIVGGQVSSVIVDTVPGDQCLSSPVAETGIIGAPAASEKLTTSESTQDLIEAQNSNLNPNSSQPIKPSLREFQRKHSSRRSLKRPEAPARAEFQAPSTLSFDSTEPAEVPMEAQAKQRQLQRALVLAQKYNYSPAKLAASKLSAKLQLKDLSAVDKLDKDITRVDSNDSHTLKWQASITRNEATGQEPVSVTGQVQLDISYLAQSGLLVIHVLECSQLAAVSKRRSTSNPYVKLYLLPDRSRAGKRKSSVRKAQLSPKFDEKFTFGPLQMAELGPHRSLWLSVWHKDRLGRNVFLGELLLPLSEVRHQLLTSDLCQSTSARWYKLQPRHQPSRTEPTGSQLPTDKLDELQRKAARLTSAVAASGGGQSQGSGMSVTLGPITNGLTVRKPNITGQLFVALKFVTTGPRNCRQAEGELHVIVKEAHDIGGFESSATLPPIADKLDTQTRPTPPTGSLPNPFCKLYLLGSQGQRLNKQRTPQLKRTANPRWDHTCVFPSTKLASLDSQALEIAMLSRDSILVTHNEYLGAVRLCCKPCAPDQQQSTNNNSQPERDSFTKRDITTDGLCNERESRLWSQMLAKPNIWVYGELRLRQLCPLVAAKQPQ